MSSSIMALSLILCCSLVSISNGYIYGSVQSTLGESEVSLHIEGNTLDIRMKGPAHRWFGFGFGSEEMHGTYAIVAAGDYVTEHILDRESTSQADTILPRPTITVKSDVVEGDYRIVTVTRSSKPPTIFEVGDLILISATADPNGGIFDKISYHGPHY